MPGPNREQVTVVLVDDDLLDRRDLASAIAAHPRLRVVGQTADPDLAVRLIAAYPPRVVVLEPLIGHDLGRRLVRRLRARAASTRVLIRTASTDTRVLLQAGRAGAAGIASKHEDHVQTCARIPAVATEAATVTPELEDLLDENTNAAPALTQREYEILRLTATGMLTPDIAQLMHLSQSTIKTHNKKLYAKLGVHERAAAVSAGYRHGLLPHKRQPDL